MTVESTFIYSPSIQTLKFSRCLVIRRLFWFSIPRQNYSSFKTPSHISAKKSRLCFILTLFQVFFKKLSKNPQKIFKKRLIINNNIDCKTKNIFKYIWDARIAIEIECLECTFRSSQISLARHLIGR